MDEKTAATIASALAQKTCDAIAKDPENIEAREKEFSDLKRAVVREAAASVFGDRLSSIHNEPELLYSIAQALPGFEIESFLQSRTSFQSLAAAVVVGWIVGGLVSGFFSLFSLGGDILRAAAIFLAVWGSEYLAINPRARRVFLTCLGLGGLIRFAGMAASGLVRLANPLSWRALIFPGKAPFFKGIWLMAGAFFIVVFFSRKAAGFNMPEMRENLEKKLAGDLRLVALFLSRIDERDAKIKKLLDSVDAREKDELLKRQKEVINSLIDIRDSLNPDQKTFLTQKLARAGIETSDDDFIIWRAAEHDALYDTVGLINDGDRARVLKPAENWNGKIVKGRAQRVY